MKRSTDVDLRKKMAAAKQAVKKLNEQFKKEGKAILLAALRPVFDAHPELRSFHWTQYTPFFNDGDTRRFSVHRLTHVIDGEDESDDEALCDAIDNAMEAFDDDDLEIIFGDHAKVVVTKTKITVEEYEHD